MTGIDHRKTSAMNLARRSVVSTLWNSTATLAGILIHPARAIILARLLPIEIFGVYALATSLTELSSTFSDIGTSGAFLHRSPETEDEEQAAAAHFTLRLILISLWFLLFLLATSIFASGEMRTALLVLLVTTTGLHLCQTPRLILTRRVVHRRMALIQTVVTTVASTTMVVLAWLGYELWALLSANLISSFVNIFALYMWRPVWRPRLLWSPRRFRYFVTYGIQVFFGATLSRALDRLDNLWVGFYLGMGPLGLYGRAYRFASYPRQAIATPVNTVIRGTYAALKDDRLRLSKSFFRTNALLTYSGFFFSGLMILVAPEFIRIALGVKWLPMLLPFRLLLVFALLDPIKVTVGSLLIAVGRPDLPVKARLVQLLVLIVGIYVFGLRWGIVGVAIAVDCMLAVGIVILFGQAQHFVDFSLRKLFLAPLLSLGAGLLLARAALLLPGIMGSDWHTATIKTITFALIYTTGIVLLNRNQIPELLSFANQFLLKARRPSKS